MKKQDFDPRKSSDRVFNLIIVDESGSMDIIRKQAFNGMNETLQTIRRMQEKYPLRDQRVTLLTFNNDHTTWHYDNLPATETKDLSWDAYTPNSCTPLYDAMGAAISKVNTQTSDGDHVLVTIITDGEENCSRAWTLPMIRSIVGNLKKLKATDWTFTLIGTDNLDVKKMANSFEIEDHLEFHQDEDGTDEMFSRVSQSCASYNRCVDSDIIIPKGKFFDEE